MINRFTHGQASARQAISTAKAVFTFAEKL
jgi:hypothetical protein